jgi:SAM-dependent methyltransferase
MRAGPVSTQLPELLVCPSCRGELLETPEGVACSLCRCTYPVREGVPNFLLAPRVEAEQPPPGLVGHAVRSVVRIPFVNDLVQRLAGVERVSQRIRPILAEAGGALVLDVGAGTGNYEALLPRSARYLWLDTDSKKLAGFRAKSRAPAVLGDATRMPLRDGSVDWALAVGMSHHLTNSELSRMLDELRRVVGQRLFFLEPVATSSYRSRLLWRYDLGRYPRSADALRTELAARFSIISEEEFSILHHYFLVTAE